MTRDMDGYKGSPLSQKMLGQKLKTALKATAASVFVATAAHGALYAGKGDLKLKEVSTGNTLSMHGIGARASFGAFYAAENAGGQTINALKARGVSDDVALAGGMAVAAISTPGEFVGGFVGGAARGAFDAKDRAKPDVEVIKTTAPETNKTTSPTRKSRPMTFG